MKKILALVLCLCMIIPMVAFAEDDTIELTFWIRTGDAFVEDQLAAYMADHPNIKITTEAVGSGYGDLRTKFSLGMQGEDLPDMSIAGWSGIGTLFDAGAIVDIQTIPGWEETSKDLVEVFSKRCLYKDAVVAIPYQVSAPVMYYNKTMLEAKNLTVPTNYDELMATAEKCIEKDETGSTTVYGFNTADDINWYLIPMVYDFGGSFTDADENCKLDTEATLQVYTWWAEMVKKGILPANQHATAKEDFANGYSAFYFNSCAGYTELAEAVGDNFELGVAYFPMQVTQQVNLGGNGIIIFSKDEAKQKAILDVAAYLLQPEQLTAVVDKGYLPVSNSMLNSDYVANKIANDPNMQVIYNQVNYITVFIQHPAYSKATSLMKALASDIEADPDADITGLIAEMQQEIDEYMEDYQ